MSRTPTLDALLSGASRPATTLPMSADDAHRVADALYAGKAPLRTPVLDKRLSLAKREFDNPAYVDAIVRNVAKTPPDGLYTVRDIRRIARSRHADAPIDISSLATIAAGLLVEYERAQEDGESACDALDRRFCAFLLPFANVSSRMIDALGAGAGGRRQIVSQLAGMPMHDYRRIAAALGMSPTPMNSLMLRFCTMPVSSYSSCIERMGIPLPKEDDCDCDDWLLYSFLSYYGPYDELDRDERLMRARDAILAPLAYAGTGTTVVPTRQSALTPTLF